LTFGIGVWVGQSEWGGSNHLSIHTYVGSPPVRRQQLASATSSSFHHQFIHLQSTQHRDQVHAHLLSPIFSFQSAVQFRRRFAGDHRQPQKSLVGQPVHTHPSHFVEELLPAAQNKPASQSQFMSSSFPTSLPTSFPTSFSEFFRFFPFFRLGACASFYQYILLFWMPPTHMRNEFYNVSNSAKYSTIFLCIFLQFMPIHTVTGFDFSADELYRFSTHFFSVFP
jgi:hypothetical protein